MAPSPPLAHHPPGIPRRPPSGGRRLSAALVLGAPHTRVRFAHNSELQFAKVLDFYGVVWCYEPRTFVLERDSHGNPAQAFAPDFYLPAQDLYVEITTLNQRLVTKKNNKVRKLRELYPEVSIKVFYQRDYLNLLLKYGLDPPSQRPDMAQMLGPVSGPVTVGGNATVTGLARRVSVPGNADSARRPA